MTVTKKYLSDHKSNLHTPDSWGRALAEQIINAAISKLGDKSAEDVALDVKFHITAFEPKTCIRICGEINGVYICYHQNF